VVCLGTFWGKFSFSGDFLDKCLVSVRFLIFGFHGNLWGIFFGGFFMFFFENPDRFHVSTPPPKNPEKKN